MNWIKVLKRILKSKWLKQSPCKTPRLTGMAGVINWSVMMDVLKSKERLQSNIECRQEHGG